MRNEYFEKAIESGVGTICLLRTEGLAFRKDFIDRYRFNFSFRRIMYLPVDANDVILNRFWGSEDVIDFMVVDNNTILFRTNTPPVNVMEYFIICWASIEPETPSVFMYLDNNTGRIGDISCIDGRVESHSLLPDTEPTDERYNTTKDMIIKEMSTLPSNFVELESIKNIIVTINSNIRADVTMITNHILRYLLKNGKMLDLSVISSEVLLFTITPEFNLTNFKDALKEALSLFGIQLGVSSIRLEIYNNIGNRITSVHEVTRDEE